MNFRKPRLGFISPVFLFPNDAGGKIRTTNILRGLKGGAFDVVLVSVATDVQENEWREEISSICDQFVRWEPTAPKANLLRVFDLLNPLPINVLADKTEAGLQVVGYQVANAALDIVIFDFVHSAVLMPPTVGCASVCFTHNVEAEIFERHAAQAKNPLRRWVWASQYKKMYSYERSALRRFDAVIAVSERDAEHFRVRYEIANPQAIPTGVDLDFFGWQQPPADDNTASPMVVFTGSMNWMANIDGVKYFLQEVWPNVLAQMPGAQFVVVGKNPPNNLTQMASQTSNVRFTGFVDDVRPYVHAASAFVIPLLVGGGTRIKAFEAMAMGCPVVSTAIGMEGLEAQPDVHFIERDESASMAHAIVSLLKDGKLRQRVSINARRLVEERFGHKVAAKAFEDICLDVLSNGSEN